MHMYLVSPLEYIKKVNVYPFSSRKHTIYVVLRMWNRDIARNHGEGTHPTETSEVYENKSIKIATLAHFQEPGNYSV